MTAAQLADRIEEVSESIRDHRGNPWGSRLAVCALEREMDALYSTEPDGVEPALVADGRAK